MQADNTVACRARSRRARRWRAHQRDLAVIDRASLLEAPQTREDLMPTFICSFSFTDAGIRGIMDTTNRRAQARMRAGKLGIKVKEMYLTSGDSDLLYILEAPNG